MNPSSENKSTDEVKSVYGSIRKEDMGSKIVSTSVSSVVVAATTTTTTSVKSIPVKKDSSMEFNVLLDFVSKRTDSINPVELTRELIQFVSVKDDGKVEGIEELLGCALDKDEFSMIMALVKKVQEVEGLQYAARETNDEGNGGNGNEISVVFNEEEEEEELIQKESFTENDVTTTTVEEEEEEVLKMSSTSASLADLIDGFITKKDHLKELTIKIYQVLLQTREKSLSVLEGELLELLLSLDDTAEIAKEDKVFELVRLVCKNRQEYLREAERFREKHMEVDKEEEEEEEEEVGDRKRRRITPAAQKQQQQHPPMIEPNVVDLDGMQLKEGSHTMSKSKIMLPQGSYKEVYDGYEEVHVPYAQKTVTENEEEKLVKVESMPWFARRAFKNITELNRVQSKVYQSAMFSSSSNLLICAPTGAGKTNCALLCVLNEIGKYVLGSSSSSQTDTESIKVDKNFLVVYVAPMKALVQEMVLNFRRRLSTVYDGLQVRELTGDQSMTQQEINQTQIIVTTPEKFDIVTRKSPYYMEKLRLVIIDEIHLLHDERGHVLESLVSRMLRYSEDTQQNVRLVGLSATLPNYMDVSIFLRTAADSVFYFDASYRPCPLKQAYIGVTSQGISKRAQVMNKVCYEKCLQQCARQNQVLVFVHSRKDTHRTAQQIRDLAISEETLGTFLPAQSESRRVLEEEIENVHSKELRDLLPYGFAIHHAGMNRGDRQLVEDLFADGHVKVLVSTATLAWGVNLPAHCVIIKGTKVYNPEKGEYTELSIQDVLQMFGRAGRPQYDTYGEAIIITSQDEVLFYLSLINTQLPIESQLVSRLPDALNAEVVLNTVKSLNDAIEWLGYSYLYVRMLRNPELYGISAVELKNDPKLIAKRNDLAHTALLLLEKSHLVKYDHRSKQVQPTEMGRIASHYYVTYKSMFTYLQQLKPWMNLIDILRVFSMSEEFRLIPIRPEEKVELERLLERVPVPVKDPLDESNVAKINVLLQAYISQLKLDGFALLSDMVYVQQSASRILRAMFEIALKRDWAELSHKLLDLCQMVEHRQWSSMSVLRQTPRPNLDSEQMRRVPLELVKKIEKTNIPYERLFDLNEAELGELVRNSKAGKLLYQAIHVLPKVEVEVRVMPITRTMIKLEISLNPTFNPIDNAESMDACLFWVLVEDASGQQILHKSQVLVRPSRQVFTECYVSVPNIGNISNIFVSLVPDRLLGLETRLAISFRQLTLPSKFLPPTELVDLSPATLREVYLKLKQQDRSILKYSAPGFDNVLNSVINNCVKPVLFGSEENEGNTLLVCANNNDLNVVAELFIAKEFRKDHCVLYCCENTERASFVTSRLEKVFHEEKKLRITIDASLFGSKSVAANVSANVLVSAYKDLDIKLKRMMKDKNRIPFACVVCEDIDLMGQDYKIETALSRLMRICEVDEAKLLCLSKSITTSKELSEFLKISSPANALNFGPNIRDLPLEIHLNGVNNNSYYTSSNIDIVTTQLLQSASVKNLLRSVLTANNDPENEKMIMFFPSKRQIKLVLNDIIRLYDKTVGVKNEDDNMDVGKVENSVLQNLLKLTGDEISFVYEGLSTSDVNHCNRLFVEGKTKILLCTKPVLQKLYYSGLRLFAPIVAILGTSYYEPLVELRNKEYSVHDLYEMILFSQPCLGDPSPLANDEESGTAKLYLYSSSNSAFYKKFLFEGIPVESCLDLNLHNFVLDELISLGTVSNRQEAVESLSNSFYYKRLSKNPNYYNLYLQSGVTHLTRALVNEKLSELVETTFDELSNSKLIVEESEDMEERYSPLNLGLIASHYNIDYVTIDVYSISLNRHSKMKSILEVLAFSNEFIQTVPVREDELDTFYSKYCSAVPLKVASDDMNAGVKTFTLYQCYFSRFNLPSDLRIDLHSLILPKTLNHLYAIIDVLSSNSHLAPTLLCMELCQMIVQAQWDKDSPLLQLPHLTHNLINTKCKKLNIETIFDLLEYINSLDEGAKNEVFEGLSAKQIQEIADICNAYPNIETKFQVSYDEEQQDEDAGDEEENEIPFTLDIELSKDVEEEDEIEEWVTFKHYQPDTSKQISRWLVVGSMQTKELLSIKRFSFNAKNSRMETVQDEDGEEETKCVYRTKLSWSLNKEIFEQVKKGEDKLKLYLMSDSWVGCDQEYDIEL